MNEYLLKAENIYKSYYLGTTEVPVLKGASLAVKPGEFVSIVGSSGSGKSTLLHIIGTLDEPDKGSVFFRGHDLAAVSGREINKIRNKKIGFVFQFYHLLDELNVLENVYLPAMASSSIFGWMVNRKKAKARAISLLEMLGMEHRIKHRPYQLSGGERQRTAIARALMNEPQVLLADEPTGNLDFETGNGILEVFEGLNRSGQTIVMVTHDQKVASRAGKTIKLVDGRVESGR